MDYRDWQRPYAPNSVQAWCVRLLESDTALTSKPYIAYVGAALILIGAMLPDLNIGLAMDIESQQHDFVFGSTQAWSLYKSGWGLIVMGLAVAATVFNYKHEDKYLRYCGVVAFFLSVYEYFNTISYMALFAGLTSGFGMLHRGGDGLFTSSPWSFAWGTIVLVLGMAMVVVASYIDNHDTWSSGNYTSGWN